MEGKKKWLVVVRVDQYQWLKDTAKKNQLKGSDILSEALDRVMNDREFISNLEETRLKVRLQELNDRAAEIEQAKEDIKRQYKESTGKERIRI